MKNLLSSLFNRKNEPQSESFASIDPKRILFSIPTLSDDIAPLEPLRVRPSSKDFAFHEDDWSQIEFFPRSQLNTVQQLLKEYTQFEKDHRANGGWSEVYVRKIQRVPVLSAPDPIEILEELLGVKVGPGPILYTSSEITGRVKNGFSIPLGGNVTIYGYVDHQDIPVLGANVGKNPDDLRLTDAFMKLNASDEVFLVDWRAQLLMIDFDEASKIEVWRP
jgi:hypothetical protein